MGWGLHPSKSHRVSIGTADVYPIQKQARELGRSMQVGIEARFRAINEAGGIHGRTLQLKALDDRYEPVSAKKNLQQFFDPDDGVFVLLGNVGTPTAEVILPEILSNGTVLFGTFSGATLLRNVPPDHYVFNYRASYAQETEALVHYFVEVRILDPKKIAVFYQNDSYGHDGLNGVVQALRQLHIHDPPITATYDRNTAQVDQAVSAFITNRDAIDAIIIIGTYQASALFTQGMRESGYTGEIANVSFVGSRALIEEFNRLGKALGAGVLVSQVVPFYDSHAKGVLQYREALTRYFPSESPNFVSLEGYIVASIFCEALERNGRRLDTKSLITSLENIRDYDMGIGPTISFRPSRHQASQHVWGSRITQEGELESVELIPTTELKRY